jgi:putative nucleotide binding protein
MELRKPAHEEHAVILDFLPNGYPFDTRPSHLKSPIAQALGKNRFYLLELVPKREIQLQPHQEVYIGEGKREEIHHINGRLSPSKLTRTAKMELEFAIRKVVKENEAQFVDFFNRAPPLSTRMHSLELIPGLGKKRMWEILEERRGQPFESFSDLKQRVKLMPDPEQAITRRILQELQGAEKHTLFVDGSFLSKSEAEPHAQL